MLLSTYMPSFREEFEKIALPTGTHAERVDRHFTSTKPDWGDFEKGIRSRKYQKLVEQDERADEKLRRYVNNYGGYLRSDNVVGNVRSRDSGKTYPIKKLKGGRLGCACKDWQYTHSHAGTDCKHIKQFTAGKSKTAAMFPKLTVPVTSYMKNTKRRQLGQQHSMESAHLQNAILQDQVSGRS